MRPLSHFNGQTQNAGVVLNNCVTVMKCETETTSLTFPQHRLVS
jgi:hypothetical protein